MKVRLMKMAISTLLTFAGVAILYGAKQQMGGLRLDSREAAPRGATRK